MSLDIRQNDIDLNNFSPISLDGICRSCLTTSGDFVDIFNGNKTENMGMDLTVKIKEMIFECAQISVEENDGLPRLLCNVCIDRVRIAFSFKCQIRQSDIFLRRVFSLCLQKSDISEKEDDLKVNDIKPIENFNGKNNRLNIADKVDNVDENGIKTQNLISPKKKRKKTDLDLESQLEVGVSKKTSALLNVSETHFKIKKPIKKRNSLSSPLKNKNAKECVPISIINTRSSEENEIVKINVKIKNEDTNFDHGNTNILNDQQSSFDDLNVIKQEENSEHNDNSDDKNDDNLTSNEIVHSDNIMADSDMNLSDNEEITNNVESGDEKTAKKNTKKERETHPPIYDEPNTPQTCSVCNLSCANIAVLLKHRAKYHGPKKFQCLTCGSGLTTTRGLRIHMRLHTGEKPEVCVTCGKAFSDPRTLKSHERIHTGQQPFPCPLCDKRFPARLSLGLHLRSHTGERPYKCSICNKSYVQANSLEVYLQIHMRTHTGVKPYPCNLCDKAFTNNTSLSVHMLTHSGVKNYQCTVCGKRMARSGELTVHLRTHSGERPFNCPTCNKAFTNSSALRAHMPMHTGVKNYICTVCGKRVARAMELRVHMRTHTGERRHHCPHCDQRFTTSSNMKLHMRKHTGEKPFVCEVCNRRFADSHVLRNHVRTHTGERPFTCATCGHAFAQHASLRTHLNTHHKVARKLTPQINVGFKENQIITHVMQLDVKTNPQFINSIDDASLSKILTSSSNIDRSNIDLQECIPIGMSPSQIIHEPNQFNSSINAHQALNIIQNRNGNNFVPACSSTSSIS